MAYKLSLAEIESHLLIEIWCFPYMLVPRQFVLFLCLSEVHLSNCILNKSFQMNVCLKYRVLKMSISNGYMLKNYVVRFTTILPPAVLKLSLQRLLKQSKNRGEWGRIYCHYCYLHFLKAKSCMFLFLEHHEDRSFKK